MNPTISRATKLRELHQTRCSMSAPTLRAFYQQQTARMQQKLSDLKDVQNEVQQAAADNNVDDLYSAKQELRVVQDELERMREQLEALTQQIQRTAGPAYAQQSARQAGSAAPSADGEDPATSKETATDNSAAAAAVDDAGANKSVNRTNSRYSRRRVFIESLGSRKFLNVPADEAPLPTLETN